MNQQFLLKIFSGPHVGAEIVLKDGLYVIGLDDDCDLIFHDQNLADKHLTLTINSGQLAVAPFGKEVVRVNGDRIPEGQQFEMEPFAIVTVGTTHFSVGPEDEKWPMFFLPDLMNPNPGEEPVEDQNQAEAQQTEDADEDVDSDEEQEDEDQDQEAAPKKRGRVRFAAVAVLVALVAFFFLTNDQGDQAHAGEQAQELSPTERIHEVLARLELANLNFYQKENRQLAISGYVVANQIKTELTRELKKISPSMAIDIWAIDVLLDSVREVLVIYQLDLEVASLGQGDIVIRGFSEKAEPVLNAVRTILADIPGVEAITNEVVTWPDMLNFFARELRETNLIDLVKLELHSEKRLVVKGFLSDAQRQRWNAVLAAYRAKFGEVLEVSEQFNRIEPVARKRRSANRDLNVEITGVNVGKLRYVTTASGDKLFEGSKLPGGQTIKTITGNKLVLDHNGEEFEYRIGGS
ncbi:type III secretion system inner membrane ring subunit SctD [Sulfidibacter corallicola]|uniref:Type III secretion system inner membrane ring subunit SctD n=1 Tax=Sulfidibacter corallicola TaxID=2818388 RepID=A0A8A4TNK2_SULCO|nr:type III secretion system inner membrane ring subunit SctD [Sulfidibacter corallicola]QTD51133.1 type III secretion system inner membrane ring subunit SctD [Sulfidibacter corallicola]